MSSIIYELDQLYKRTFGSRPYVVPKLTPNEIKGDPYNISSIAAEQTKDDAYKINIRNVNTQQISSKGSLYKDTYLGVEIWLPTKLFDINGNTFYLPYSVVRVTGSSSWVKTPLAERKGSAKELYTIDDYIITLKGFFIDKANYFFPTEDLALLKKYHERGESLFLSNALTDIFLDVETKVVMEKFELHEVEGGRKHVRPFSMQFTSDNVFTLEYTGT